MKKHEGWTGQHGDTKDGRFKVEIIADDAPTEWIANGLRFPDCATADAYGLYMLRIWTSAQEYRVYEMGEDGERVVTSIYIEKPDEAPKTKTLPLAPGEEDNAKYRLRDGTRTGCKVLAELDMPTESDIQSGRW